MICEDKYPGPYTEPFMIGGDWEPVIYNGELVGFRLGTDPVTVELA